MTLTTIEKDGVFYNFHYIGRNNQWWKDFATMQKTQSRDHVVGGILGFLHSIPNTNHSHIWVAYISNTKPKELSPLDEEIPTIEMVVSVTTSELSCFSMHMGIFRSKLYEGEKHPNISMKLHGFAAQQLANKPFDIPKTYMVTTPLDHMRGIMQNAFESHEKQLYTEQDGYIFKINGRGKSTFNSLFMYDQSGTEIFHWTQDDHEMNQNMSWFSSHRDVLGTPHPFVIAKLDDLMNVGGFAPRSGSEEAGASSGIENISIHNKVEDIAICDENIEVLGKILESVDAQTIE